MVIIQFKVQISKFKVATSIPEPPAMQTAETGGTAGSLAVAHIIFTIGAVDKLRGMEGGGDAQGCRQG